jgi:transketolase
LQQSAVVAGDTGPNRPISRELGDNSSSAAWQKRARLRLLQMHYESRVGHLGGNLSALDLLLALFHDVMGSQDQFVLSKGHAAGALYIALWTLGRLSEAELKEFHRDGTRLSGHPPARGIDDVLFATGSLGHGLGLAAGLALGKRFQEQAGRIFCVTSDGEWNEGSTWESLIFSRHQKLSNLVVIIDQNGLQGFGTTREVADIAPLSEKFRTFGVETLEVDGHDLPALIGALRTSSAEGPLFVVAQTRKGCGVSFMQDRMEWHYLPLTAEQYALAVQEVSAS